MIQYTSTFADAPDYSMEPYQEATFSAYMDLPDHYDTLKFLPNYGLILTGPVILAGLEAADDKDTFEQLELSQNYPNSFNARTTICFTLDRAGCSVTTTFSSGLNRRNESEAGKTLRR